MSFRKEGPLFLGIDCGTSGLEAACYHSDGRALARNKRPLETSYPFPLAAEQDPQAWWQALIEATQEIRRQDKAAAERIEAIGVCATCSTLVPCNDRLTPLDAAIMWLDNRAIQEAEELRDALSRAERPTALSSEQMAPKLLWLARHRPDLLRGRLVESASWLVHALTGQLVLSELVSQTTWGILPDQWSGLGRITDEVEPHLQAVRLKPRPATSPAGKLKPDIAQELGLSREKEIIVAVGGNDGLHGAVGAGLLADVPRAIEVGGTSYVLFAKSKERPRAVPAEIGFMASPFEVGSWLLFSSIESAGLFLDWWRDLVRLTPKELATTDKALAESLLSGNCQPSLVAVDASLQGEKRQASIPQGGALKNLWPATTRKEITQAIFEEVAHVAQNRLDLIRSLTQIEEVKLAGGWSRGAFFPLLRASLVMADYPLLKVDRVAEENPGCLGVAMTAACAAGIYPNLITASQAMASESSPLKGLAEAGQKLIKHKKGILFQRKA